MTDDKLLAAFNMLDMDGNGRITKSDLEKVFKNSADMNNEILDEMMMEADINCANEITY